MPDGRHALFDTALGRCGVAWHGQALLAVQLPETNDGCTTRCLLKNANAHANAHADADADADAYPEASAPGDWPPMVVQAVEGIQALLRGAPRDLREVPLQMSGISGFQRAVYALARAIPVGQTRTYGELALELGDVKLARAVGQALGRNPFAPVVPCHRVLAAGDRPGGFSAGGGASTKLRMLAIEGAVQGGTLPLFD